MTHDDGVAIPLARHVPVRETKLLAKRNIADSPPADGASLGHSDAVSNAHVCMIEQVPVGARGGARPLEVHVSPLAMNLDDRVVREAKRGGASQGVTPRQCRRAAEPSDILAASKSRGGEQTKAVTA